MKYESNSSVALQSSGWHSLKDFGIFSVTGGNQLYSNGNQQLMVRVFVQVQSWLSTSLPLTQAEIDSIVLLDGHTGAELIKDRNRGDVGVWKYIDIKDTRFRQLPPNLPAQGSVPSGDFVYIKDFYVTSSSDKPIELQLQITRADGITFQSRKQDEFGTLTLVPLPPAIYRSEQYSLIRTPVPYSSPRGHIEKVEVFMLDLVVDQQRMRFFDGFIMGPHPRMGSSDKRYSGYYLVGYGNGRYIHSGGPVSWEQPHALGRQQSENGRVALVMAYGKLGPVWVRETIKSSGLEMLDMYGNLHELRVELSDDPLTVRVTRI